MTTYHVQLHGQKQYPPVVFVIECQQIMELYLGYQMCEGSLGLLFALGLSYSQL